jgi:hypothetical protein
MTCVSASAQTGPGYRPERPYRGIFASGVDGLGQSLTANGTVSGGYDDNLLADATNSSSPRSGRQGALAQVSGGLNYNLTSERAELQAGAGASLRYYPSFVQDYYRTYNANLSGVLRVLDKPNLTAYGSVGYQPVTFLSGLPGVDLDPGLEALVPPDLDFIASTAQYLSYESGASLNVPLSRRLSFVSSYSYRVSDRSDHRVWRQTGVMGLDYELSRDLSLRTGYRYTEAHYPTRTVHTHSPDVGLDFHRALSLTRRTSLSFGAGVEATQTNDHTRYRATSHVNLAHEIGRSWFANAAYRRGTFFIDTLAEPVFGDSASAGVNGLLTRRIQFSAVAFLSMGSAGFTEQRQFDTYRGVVTLSTALNRFMNVGADYAYYKYLFDPLIELDPGLPRNINRQSIRAHVSFWAPVMNRTRRRDASR